MQRRLVRITVIIANILLLCASSAWNISLATQAQPERPTLTPIPRPTLTPIEPTRPPKNDDDDNNTEDQSTEVPVETIPPQPMTPIVMPTSTQIPSPTITTEAATPVPTPQSLPQTGGSTNILIALLLVGITIVGLGISTWFVRFNRK